MNDPTKLKAALAVRISPIWGVESVLYRPNFTDRRLKRGRLSKKKKKRRHLSNGICAIIVQNESNAVSMIRVYCMYPWVLTSKAGSRPSPLPLVVMSTKDVALHLNDESP